MFIKSNKWLILVATLCIMVTNNTNASDAIKQIDMNNIEHSSSVLASNLETVIEIHHDNKINHNNTNLEHSNLEHNNSEYQINRHHVNHKDNNNDNTHQIEHSENNLEHSNNELHHNDSEYNNHENINNGNNHINNVNNNNVRNSSEQKQNNNDAIALNINEQDVKADDKKKESFCKHLTTMTYGIVLLPMAIYGGIVSNIKLGANYMTQDISNKLTEIRNGTKEFSGVVCNNTMSAFGGCVTILCSKITNVGTNALGGAKSYVVRKIWG